MTTTPPNLFPGPDNSWFCEAIDIPHATGWQWRELANTPFRTVALGTPQMDALEAGRWVQVRRRPYEADDAIDKTVMGTGAEQYHHVTLRFGDLRERFDDTLRDPDHGNPHSVATVVFDWLRENGLD